MRVCGVELKANNTILTVAELNDDIVDYIDLKIKKIILENDEEKDDIISYAKQILSFINEEKIEQIIIKKRAKKGNFSGGAVTFKMEGIIQLNPVCEVELISGQAIGSFDRKNETEFPNTLKKYQEQSYLALLAFYS
jgi:hypothetical protein